jgi:putative membrane protein
MTPKRMALLVIFFFFAIFVVQNVEVMEVRFLFWRTGASRALVLVSTFAVGLLAGWLMVWLRKPERRGRETGRGIVAGDADGEQGGAGARSPDRARRPAAGAGGAPPKG